MFEHPPGHTLPHKVGRLLQIFREPLDDEKLVDTGVNGNNSRDASSQVNDRNCVNNNQQDCGNAAGNTGQNPAQKRVDNMGTQNSG